MEQTVSERVIRLVAEQVGVITAAVTPEMKLIDDLNCDELDAIEIVMAIEEEFEIEISDEYAEKVTTVGEAIAYVEKAVAETA